MDLHCSNSIKYDFNANHLAYFCELTGSQTGITSDIAPLLQ